MTFNNHKLDKIKLHSERKEGKLEEYKDDLMEFLCNSATKL